MASRPPALSSGVGTPTPFSHHPVLDSLGLERDNGAFDQPAEAGQGRAGQAASQHPSFRGAQWAVCGSHGPGHLRPEALVTLFNRPRPPPPPPYDLPTVGSCYKDQP